MEWLSGSLHEDYLFWISIKFLENVWCFCIVERIESVMEEGRILHQNLWENFVPVLMSASRAQRVGMIGD